MLRLQSSHESPMKPEADFDIYLPNWLARRNKLIFGALFVAGELFVLGCWLMMSPSR